MNKLEAVAEAGRRVEEALNRYNAIMGTARQAMSAITALQKARRQEIRSQYEAIMEQLKEIELQVQAQNLQKK